MVLVASGEAWPAEAALPGALVESDWAAAVWADQAAARSPGAAESAAAIVRSVVTKARASASGSRAGSGVAMMAGSVIEAISATMSAWRMASAVASSSAMWRGQMTLL